MMSQDNEYVCANTDLVLYHQGNIDNVTGHQQSYNNLTNQDVKILQIFSDHVNFIPGKIFTFFPELLHYHYVCQVPRSETSEKSITCLLDSALFKGVFKGAGSLAKLKLTGHQLKSLKGNIFQGAPSLNNLILTDCQIQIVDRSAFKKLTKLSWLDLALNDITDLEPETFDDLKELQTLHLSGNKIENLSLNLFKLNKKLNRIELDKNRLRFIEPFELPKMTISLNGNLCIDEHLEGEDLLYQRKLKRILKECSTTNEKYQVEKYLLENESLRKEIEKIPRSGFVIVCESEQARNLTNRIHELESQLTL